VKCPVAEHHLLLTGRVSYQQNIANAEAVVTKAKGTAMAHNVSKRCKFSVLTILE
jgi:hypothetical protein